MRITDSVRARAAFTLLLVGFASNLAVYFLHAIVSNLGGSAGQLAMQLIWLGISGVFLVAMIQLAACVDDPTLPWITVALIIINALIDLGFAIMSATESYSLLSFLGVLPSGVSMLLSLVERGLLLWILVSVSTPRFAWTLPVGATVMLLGVARSAFSFALTLQFVDASSLFSSGLYSLVTGAASVIGGSLSLLMAWVARVAITETAEGATLVPPREQGLQAPTTTDAPASPTADFAFGAVILMIGILVTSISASSASNGGRYIVATGAIAVGLGRIIRGFIKLGKRA